VAQLGRALGSGPRGHRFKSCRPDNFCLIMAERIHAIFIGDVQGVGFRYTAERIAKASGVCGSVRNLRDGSVEVIAEAPKEALVQFLERLKDRFAGYIRSVDVDWEPASGGFRDFSITF
jgi:acylphosphatase